VLITAAATILGLAPFLIASGLGSEVQKPLAIVVICGLITATVMTKVVVPMLYRYFDPLPDVADKGTTTPLADVPDKGITKETSRRPNLLARIRARFRRSPQTPGA
jgi:cobalt-zinc-cadmium resistance protein CzcA